MTTKRNRRSGVEDRWRKTIRVGDVEQKVPSANDGKGKRWRARYVDDLGTEHAKGFDRKADAQNWLNTATTALGTGTHVAPRNAQITVQQWCDQWILGYGVHRDSTVRQARTHIAQITAEFGKVRLSAVRPSAVKTWTSKLKVDGSRNRTSTRCIHVWRRSWAMRFMTDCLVVIRARVGHRRRWVAPRST